MNLRLSFTQQEIVVTLNQLGKQNTQRIRYRLEQKSETTFTLQLGGGDSIPHVLTLDGDRLMVEHAENVVKLIRADDEG